MNLFNLKYNKFHFSLLSKFQNSQSRISRKDAIIIQAIDEDGYHHNGEISPLIGFSTESIEQCQAQLDKIIPKLDVLNENILMVIKEQFDLYPSVLYAFEQLLLSVRLKNTKQKTKIYSVETNALIALNDKDKTLYKINEMIGLGFSTFKIKVGIANVRDEILHIKSIYQNFGDVIKIRLDCNGAWSVDETFEFLSETSDLDFEYLEQPTAKLNDLIVLSKNSKIKIAPDESIHDYETACQIVNSGIFKIIVIKPSIEIGIFNSIKLIEVANSTGIKIIITSAFESAIGKWPLLYLSSLVNHSMAHGLNTETVGANIITSTIDYSLSKIKFKSKDLISSITVNFP